MYSREIGVCLGGRLGDLHEGRSPSRALVLVLLVVSGVVGAGLEYWPTRLDGQLGSWPEFGGSGYELTRNS